MNNVLTVSPPFWVSWAHSSSHIQTQTLGSKVTSSPVFPRDGHVYNRRALTRPDKWKKAARSESWIKKLFFLELSYSAADDSVQGSTIWSPGLMLKYQTHRNVIRKIEKKIKFLAIDAKVKQKWRKYVPKTNVIFIISVNGSHPSWWPEVVLHF